MKKISEEYVWCGAFGHAWFEADSDWKPEYGTPVTLRCEHCGSERRESITPHGEVIPGSRWYWHPVGYSYHGEQRPSRADFRVAYLAKKRRDTIVRKRDNVVSLPKKRRA